MKRWIRTFGLGLVLIGSISFQLHAQPVQDNPTVLTQQTEVMLKPVGLHIIPNPPSVASMNLGDSAPSLAELSEMLNRDVQAKSATSFESMRRHQVFQLEQSIVSQFLAFDISQRSS